MYTERRVASLVFLEYCLRKARVLQLSGQLLTRVSFASLTGVSALSLLKVSKKAVLLSMSSVSMSLRETQDQFLLLKDLLFTTTCF